ncbi:hypothetical protein [Pontibacter pamirensis]|uniref:hypothetical protein n=1 Tax=Pontibacter pamirensis TaxID=2562824 RepID=UPI001389BE3A|nr:hypothetical protein [Pontibacter pamirensis]
MSAGGLRPLSRGGKGNSLINIDVIGRNFDYPTQFNQEHKYRTAKDFVTAYLIKELPPLATIAGHFRLNGSVAFVPFSTIERGTIVDEVRITANARSQVNSPDLAELSIGGGALPALTSFGEGGIRDSGAIYAYDTALVLNTPKSYTARAKDLKDVLSTQPSTTWGIGVKAWYGKGEATGAAITEAWVRANLQKHSSFNGHMPSVTVTPGSNDYIYYLAPVAWGLKVFEFLGSDQTNPESATRVRVRTDNEMLNGITQAEATEYFVIRSLGQGLGGGSSYTFQLGNIG